MRKGLAVAALVLAAAIMGLPWVLGSRARAVYEDALARLQQQGVRVLDSHYRRGWFTSDASVAIELPRSFGQPPAPVAVPLRLASQVAHGPWTHGSLRLLPSAALIESRLELLIPGIEPIPLLLTTRVELNGGGVTHMRLPELSRQSAALDMEMAEGAGELKFSAGFAAVEGELAIPSLSLSSPEGVVRGHFSIASQGLASDALARPGGWVERLAGEGELSIPRPLLLQLLEDWQYRKVLEQLQQQGLQSPALPQGLDKEVAMAAQEQLDSLVGQGWLAEKEDTLTVALRLEDTLLTVNGKSIPIGAAVSVP